MSQNKLNNKKANNLCGQKEQGRSFLMPKNGTITNLCRACLHKRKGMKFLSDSTKETNSLLAKWTSSLNFEMEVKSKYPSYLCKICETRLNSCFEFQEQCRKSNDLINQYFIALETENSFIKNEEVEHIVAGQDKLNTSKLVSHDEVSAAIQALNVKYIQDFICIFCRFELTSIEDLNLHIIEAHRDLSKNWCSLCNKLYSDDKQHLEAHRKDFLCRFCNCQLFTPESTIEHLLSHKGGNTELRLEPINNNCNESFVKREHFEDHLVFHDNTDNVCMDDIKDDDLALKTDVLIDAEVEVVELKELSKKNSANQRMRLNQYSAEDVHRAVKLVRDKLYRHVVCMFCQFEAMSTRTLSVHVTRVHREFKGRWCPSCNELVDNLALHTKDMHGEDLKCSFCNKVLSNMGHFMEHMASHSGTRLHRCTVCHKSFISARHLKTHQQTHLDDRPFVCKICNKRFLQLKILGAHIRTFHKMKLEDHCKSNNKVNVIDTDPKDETAFLSDSSENNMADLENRTIERQNYCKKCNKKVRSLRHHNNKFHSLQGLTQDRPNLCPHCGKRFKTMSKLTVHIRTHTGEKPYKCKYCEKRLKTRNILVVHERTHTGEKPYACAICGKNFAQSSVLKTHLRIHTGRPEQCTICDQRFCRPAELRLHMRKHTGEKPYTCNLCGQGFKQKSHLVEHTQRHSNDRPFKCNFCEKSFKNIGTLKCHLQIHTGDKPFKCSQCSYACRQTYSLTQHMQQHDNDRPQADHPHTCKICQRSFTTVAHLTAHYNRFHSHIDVKMGKPQREASTEEVAQFEFVDDTQQIIIDDSNQIRIVETVERVESVSTQSELDQPKFDPMFEFTVIQ